MIEIDHGDVNLEPSFQIAIYENLLDELVKTKRFRTCFATVTVAPRNVANLLILKTTVEQTRPAARRDAR